MASEVMTGCLGGVCGACTVSVRYPDGRKGGTELACLHQVEEGMQVFPFPVDPIPTKPPVKSRMRPNSGRPIPLLTVAPNAKVAPMPVRWIFLLWTRCFECKREVEQVAQDFTTCIHCGLCRAVCEDKVEPHQMGMWVRRSLGQSLPNMTPQEEPEGEAEREWGYLMEGTLEQRLERARQFRTQESLNSLEDSKE